MLDPIHKSDWNPFLAAHLLNRAGFGATPETIAEFAALNPEEAVHRLVNYESQHDKLNPPAWVDDPDVSLRPDRASIRALPENARREILQEQRQIQTGRLMELQRWWLNRMRATPNPLEEKLTLFWHGHFATSFEKVSDAYALYLQNQTLRRNATGNLKDLVVAASQDPAMLRYLDNAISRRGHPNENFARELMELFTLGEGNYSEKDIQEAARAFTGWTIDEERIQFEIRPRMHDDERKTFMGFSGNLDGYDVINEILENPACPVFIASKLWRYFAYEEVEPELSDQLGKIFYDADFKIRPLMERIFLSREFYSKKSAYAQIKSPVQWLVGSSIALEGELPDAQVCALIMRALGQELFLPPNVKGWDGGYSWITASTLMQRYNLAGYLVKGTAEMTKTDAAIPRRKRDKKTPAVAAAGPATNKMMVAESIGVLDHILPMDKRRTLEMAWSYLEWRLYQRRLDDTQKYTIWAYLTKLPMPSMWSDQELRNFLHVMMSTPYYQVC